MTLDERLSRAISFGTGVYLDYEDLLKIRRYKAIAQAVDDLEEIEGRTGDLRWIANHAEELLRGIGKEGS